MWTWKKKHGTAPDGYQPITLHPSQSSQYYYQEKQNWTWGNAPAHETRAALVNCWTGNQLPGDTNFIPGVPLSSFTWNVPTSYANTLKNQQYSAGMNIQSQSAYQSGALLQQIQQAWQNRSG